MAVRAGGAWRALCVVLVTAPALAFVPLAPPHALSARLPLSASDLPLRECMLPPLLDPRRALQRAVPLQVRSCCGQGAGGLPRVRRRGRPQGEARAAVLSSACVRFRARAYTCVREGRPEGAGGRACANCECLRPLPCQAEGRQGMSGSLEVKRAGAAMLERSVVLLGEACVCACEFVYVYVCASVCVSVSVHVSVHMYVYMYMYICVCVCMCICTCNVYACVMYLCVYTRILN
jgi:hypothetical protein